MASNLDFSADIVFSPALNNRIQRGERIKDNLPRRRFHVPEKPDRKDSGDVASPEDMEMSEKDGTERRRLDLRA